MSSTGRRLLALLLSVPVLLPIATAGHLGAQAAVPQPGEAIDVVISGKRGQVSIRFCYCPAGKLRPGKQHAQPAAGTKGKGLLAEIDTLSMRGFFISETEISLGQFRDLLGDEAILRIADRFPNLASAKSLKEADSSKDQMPVHLVTLSDAVAFCQTLSGLHAAQQGPDSGGMIATQFRVPSHHEWQYACRARTDPDQLPSMPHFNGWPDGKDSLDQATQTKADAQWEKLVKDKEDFQASQQQIAEMMELYDPTKNPEPLEVLARCLKLGLGAERNYSENKTSQYQFVGKGSKKNSWGVFNMHDNVHEWAIQLDGDKVDAYWRVLASSARPPEEDESRSVLLLAGGAHNEMMSGDKYAWKRFTIWGGIPVDNQGEPRPFSLKEQESYTKENEPGLRAVMHRTLSEGWLMAVRQSASLESSPSETTLQELRKNRTAASEVAKQEEFAEVDSRIAFYEALALSRMGRVPQAQVALQTAAGGLSRKRGTSSVLLQAVGDGSRTQGKGAETSARSEDMVLIDAVSLLLAQDTKNKTRRP